MVFVQPKESIVAKVLPHFRPAVIRTGIPPISVRAVVVIEIDATVVIPVAPTVEAPKIEVAGTEVVVNYVHDHGDTQGMRRFHKPLKALWATEGRFHCEWVRRIVTPREAHRKFQHRHDLDRINT